MLDEITKGPAALPQDEKKDAFVEIQDLVCYWDKVRYLVLTGIHTRNALSQYTRYILTNPRISFNILSPTVLLLEH